MTFRIFSVLLCLLAGLPAALAASLSAQDEARLIYLEKRLSELEGRDRELRAYADKAAKGEADGVKDIAAVQVLGAKDGLTGQLAGLNSNFNMLLGFGTAISALLIAIFGVGAWFAKREARSVAEAEMRAMDGKLEAKEQKVLNALQKKADDLIKIIETAKQQAQEHAEAASESRAKAEKEAKASSDLVKRSSTAVLSVDERIKADALKEKFKNIPPQDLNKEQLLDLIRQALADNQWAEAARYAGALTGKVQEDPYALILLARSRLAQGLTSEAVDAARLAIEVAQARRDQRAEGVAHTELGDALRKAGQLPEAKAAYGQSRAIFERLRQGEPSSTDSQRELAVAWGRVGDILREEGDLVAARDAFTRYRDLLAGLLEKDETQADWQRELALAWGRLGAVLQDEGDRSGAKGAFAKYRDHLARLVERDPTQTAWAWDLAIAWSYVGNLLLDDGDRASAALAFTEYRDRMARLTEQDPTNADWQRALAQAWGRLGDAVWDSNRDTAKLAFTEYRDRLERLVKRGVAQARGQRELTVALGRLGDFLLEEGAAEEAQAFHRQECQMSRQLAKDMPNDSSRQRDLAAVLRRYTKSTLACGDTVEAASLLEEAGKIVASLLADAPEKPIYRRDHAWIQGVRGDYHAALGNDEDARRLWLEAVTELTALEENKTLNFLGQRALKEYRAKLAAA